ncbi:DUF3870 domain-containing protein [Desulfosporosinus sp. BICA1-9]|uniref:DUF3870 domain-containing protein n=1 Tax=Desulfosporosinus sp. BICA1-9 TaxID=1531958 RepID=UPI00054C49E7|nr:DUF3870 domain-containing protein [Desulfosporosinus sp. BICA1-9]KJS46834.1 MAG: ornithine cyclodeaminase [Peptococcaceae bacterium BRH_c23]KJS80110.1 MAG: ornithine cyclodeaminase [Desulfosporosinus sp. BICA1-9]HBW34863.1 DUF3870 domain-containing protein [Desulfosporosinus sp.]
MTKQKTIMIVGHSNLPQGMAAQSLFGTFAIVTEIDKKYGVIIRVSCTLVTQQAQDFLATILVGSSLKDGLEDVFAEIKSTYHGAAQNAIIAALKDLHRIYLTLLK